MDAGSVGLPITVQVATPTFRDELCLRIMKEIEGLNTDWEVMYLVDLVKDTKHLYG